MPNVYEPELAAGPEYSRARLAEQAGAEHLGATLYELAPGQGMHFHYHLGREELLVLLHGTRAPNVSVYPDTGEVGVFDAALPSQRRFGALFDLADAVADYGGGRTDAVLPRTGGGETRS